MVNQTSKSRLEVTKSKNSQIDVGKNVNNSTIAFKDRNISNSKGRLNAKGSVVVFVQEKKDNGSISNVSLSNKKKSSHKVLPVKNQFCQTIDPRRCDELFHEGVIRYPSNKILQELAEIKKQKANRLDIHVKKEFFKRNRIKHKGPRKLGFFKGNNRVSEKGDSNNNEAPKSTQLEDDEEEDNNYDEDDDEDDEDDDDEFYEEEEDDDDDDDDDIDKTKANKNKIKESKEGKEAKTCPTDPAKQVGLSSLASRSGSASFPLKMHAADIIRKTTENLCSPKKALHFDHNPNSKGDSKAVKKPQKLSKDDEILMTVLDPHCPPGHIPLPDVERKKTLHMLRVSHAELVREMNLLPVRTDTLRIRQKKMQLETQLNKIEEGIKVFNKSRVYVKIEE